MAEEASGPTRVATDEATIRPASEQHNIGRLSREVLRSLEQRSNVRGLTQLVIHAGLIAACGYGYLRHGSRACLVGQAFCGAFLFNALHECVHHTAFRTRWMNRVAGHTFGLLTLRPMNHYTFYHYNHHKFTGDPKRDPELQESFIDLRLDSPVPYLAYLSGAPFWLDRVSTLLRHAVAGWVLPREQLFLTPSTRATMLAEARCYVAVYTAVVAAAVLDRGGAVRHAIIHGWVLPTLLAQPFLRFYLVAEHTGCPNTDDMLSNTRTTETFWWYRLLAWQMPFHAEHHAFPFVPFHRLAALHEALKASGLKAAQHCTPTGEGGYFGVHVGIVRSFLRGTKGSEQE